jgi:hypothetical protein
MGLILNGMANQKEFALMMPNMVVKRRRALASCPINVVLC